MKVQHEQQQKREKMVGARAFSVSTAPQNKRPAFSGFDHITEVDDVELKGGAPERVLTTSDGVSYNSTREMEVKLTELESDMAEMRGEIE